MDLTLAEKLRNIGPASAAWLTEVGVASLEDLRRVGVVEAYAMVKRLQPGASLNLLYALEGARRDLDWRALSPEEKQSLRDELERLTAG